MRQQKAYVAGRGWEVGMVRMVLLLLLGLGLEPVKVEKLGPRLKFQGDTPAFSHQPPLFCNFHSPTSPQKHIHAHVLTHEHIHALLPGT